MNDEDIKNLLLEKQKSHASQNLPDGNTKRRPAPPSANPVPKHPKNQLYVWFFTLKKDDITVSQLWSSLNEIAKKFIFQIEKGESSEYYHYQGVFSLYQKEYFHTVKNLFPNTIHLEQCKNYFQAEKYCSKNETRISGPWDKNKKPLKEIKIYGWQKTLEKKLLEIPDERSIYWYWDNEGKKGKTTFCKYMIAEHGASYVSNARTSDIAFSLKDDPKIILFDFSRSLENRVNYGALEQCKNGLVFSAKYESKLKIFDTPHIVVFANFYPNLEKLSIDRWEIISLNKKEKPVLNIESSDDEEL